MASRPWPPPGALAGLGQSSELGLLWDHGSIRYRAAEAAAQAGDEEDPMR